MSRRVDPDTFYLELDPDDTQELTDEDILDENDERFYDLLPDRKQTNPKDRAATHRLDMSLVPFSAIAYTALALTEGDCKYGGYNWRDAGVSFNVYVAATMRHWGKLYSGEWADPVTHVPHLASIAADASVIIDAYESGKLIDDRPPKQDHARLLAEFEGIVKHLHELYPNGPPRHRERP